MDKNIDINIIFTHIKVGLAQWQNYIGQFIP